MNRTIFTAMIILHTFVLAAQNLYEQNRSAGSRQNLSESATVVKGIIRTSDGKPAANVNVILKDTRFASVTNELGEYYFYNVPEGGYTVVVSFTGLKTVQKEFDLKKGDVKVFDFTLYENQYQLAEIIIKAYNNNNTKAAAIGKINIRPMDLPQSIATVSETVIRDQQAQRLSDVVKNVNGVYLSSARASTQESFYARGYSFSSTNMFKNGSRVNSGVMPEVSSLESVEILKGSAAILYGNVSPGGILNMITKKPKFAFGGEVSMRAGSFNLWKPSMICMDRLQKR